MRKSLVLLSAFALSSVLLTGTAKADPAWTYTAEAKSIVGTGPNPAVVANSSIDFIPAYGGGTVNGSGSVIVYRVKTNTNAAQADALAFDSSFNLPITMVDLASQGAASDKSAIATGVVNLTGYLKADNVSGTTFNYLDHGLDTNPLPKLTLGSDSTGWWDYVVKGISFTPPGVPVGDDATGSIYVSVTVTQGTRPDGGNTGGGPTDPPPPSQTPEPTSLVLAGLALPLGLVARRRKKAQADA